MQRRPAGPGLTERLAVYSERHRRRVAVAWGLAVIAALLLALTSLHGLTTSGYVVGSTQSSQAKALYDQAFPGVAAQRPTDVVVVHSDPYSVESPRFESFVHQLETAVRTAPGVSDVTTDLALGSPFVGDGGHAALITLRADADAAIVPVVRTVQHFDRFKGISAAITGTRSVGQDFSVLSSSDLRRGEVDFGLPIALVILVLVFGAVVAGLLPVFMALVSIAVGLGLATFISYEFRLSVFIVNMMTGMGLALGIDYSLFVVSRFRDERAEGSDKQEAVRKAGATAGRAVLVSGSTFVVALFGLLLVPTNVLRSLAAGAIIVGVVSVAAALTLLPSVLSAFGDKVNALRVPYFGRNLGRTGPGEARYWRAAVTRVMRHPVASLVVGVGLLLLCVIPLLGLHVGESGVSTLPDSATSKQGYLTVARYFPNLVPDPVTVVADRATGTTTRDLSRLEVAMAGEPAFFGHGTITRSPDDRVLALVVPIRGDDVSNSDVAAVVDVRQRLVPAAFAGSSTAVYVGGQTASTADYFHAVSTLTPFVFAFVLGISFVLLLLAFRSLVIAAVSIALNLLAVGAAYGLLTLVFIHGVGAGLFGFQQVSAIDAWVPLFLFSVLFALSMDYQVFLVSRIAEQYGRLGSTPAAVTEGVATTARLITGAALIIVVVFAGFARGQLVQFQQMGFGVAVALILDATIIRTVILPSAFGLLDDRTWYLPQWLEWLPHLDL